MEIPVRVAERLRHLYRQRADLEGELGAHDARAAMYLAGVADALGFDVERIAAIDPEARMIEVADDLPNP